MIIRRLTIENFRGVRSATLHFSGNTLLLGPNNVGKSTVLEALDLLLGPERQSRTGAIDEHDFYNSIYRAEDTSPVQLRLEAVLTGLDSDARRAFRQHLEWWDRESSSLVETAEQITEPRCEPAVRVGFRGFYDPDEDEFRTSSYFCHPVSADDEEPPPFTRTDKRLCGFLYLRSLRTGSRALSLEKGTLLDIVLQLKEVQAAGLWEGLLTQLRLVGPAVDGHQQLRDVLDGIEDRVRQYIPLASEGRASGFHVTNLTRDELRRVVSLFLTCQPSAAAVPFQHSGSGTLNVLVLAMLSFIADLKENFIFAMEEPEIAIPPYTQRRIVDRLREKAQQCVVTSHSPYVAERFLPDELVVLRRGVNHELISTQVQLGEDIKRKMFRRDFRTRFAEGMLSRAILLVEGVTEREAVPVASDRIAAADSSYLPLDVCGVTVIEAGGDGGIEALAAFFRRLGLHVYAIVDKQSDSENADRIMAACNRVLEHSHRGFERLLTKTLPVQILRQFVEDASAWNTFPAVGTPPAESSPEEEVREFTLKILKARKGEGYAAELVARCDAPQLPIELTTILRQIAADLQPSPARVPSGS